MKPIDLNELPRHSKRVAELLGKNPEQRVKNNEQIFREFGEEKWGGLLKRWLAQPCGIDEVRNWECPAELEHCGIVGGKLVQLTTAEARSIYISRIEQELADAQTKHLVEMGCGYGSVLFDLVSRGRLSFATVTGLEYTPQGVELAKKLASWHRYDISIGRGDYNDARIADIPIAKGCDIFSSYSLHYVRNVKDAIKNLIQLGPRRVVHFEPVYEHCQDDTLLGILQRRYMEVNDYNLSILEDLKALAACGDVEIVLEQPQVFGINCLLPASIITWRPVK